MQCTQLVTSTTFSTTAAAVTTSATTTSSISTCSSINCQNGGTCTGATCVCPANVYGPNCQYVVSASTCATGDTDSTNCPLWSSLGLCSFTYLYNSIPVPVYCPKSCGLCRNTNTCKDTQSSCAVWATLGQCGYLNTINPNLCQYSCGNCQTTLNAKNNRK